MCPPESGAPVVERCRILGPGRTVVRALERIRVLDGAPRWIEWLLRGRWTYVTDEALLDRANFFDVLLSLEQRDLVLAAAEGWPAQLGQIILPQADQANIVG